MQVDTSKKPARAGHYRWWIVGASFLMVFTCLGFCSSTKGLYLAAITEALNLERSLFSFNDSVRYLTTAALNLFFGALVARFGPRRLAAAGFAALIASMLVYSFAKSIYVFCLGGMLLGMGLAWTTTTMVGYMVDAWCRERKGTVMGAVLAANGLGGALAAQVLSPVIYSADPFGYRTSYRITAVILLAVGAFVVLVYPRFNHATQSPAPAGKKPKGRTWEGVTFEEAVHRPFFWVAAVCVFLTGMALQGVHGISSAHLKDVGFEPSLVATVVSVHSVALAACKFLTGMCYDRCGLRKTILLCDAAALVMALLLSSAAGTPSGRYMALGYALVSAAALPLETIMLPLITGELFGQRAYGKLLGLFVAINTFGYAAAGPLSNLFFDLTGTYRQIILGMGGVMLAVTCAFQWVLSQAAKTRAGMR